MNKSGPIIIIEDNEDDQDTLTDVLKDLGYPNQVIFFHNGINALDYLNDTDERPFIILSDINLPRLSGLELREKIHNNEQLSLKCIPYLFFTTVAQEKHIVEAYSSSVQGFFIKPVSYFETYRLMTSIIEYWKYCKAPERC